MNPWNIEKLDKNSHDRVNFSCGINILDEFLKTRANKEQKHHLNITYVATPVNNINGLLKPIAGYFTLSNNALKMNNVPAFIQKGIPSTYEIPAILIGRLAVDQKYQNQGIGEFLLKNAFLKIIETATLTGIKCISITAKNDNAVTFYKKYGFVKLKDSNQLVLPIETLIKAIQPEKAKAQPLTA